MERGKNDMYRTVSYGRRFMLAGEGQFDDQGPGCLLRYLGLVRIWDEGAGIAPGRTLEYR